MHFTWPSRAYFDDRDTNRSNGNGGAATRGTTATGHVPADPGYARVLELAPGTGFHQYLTAVRQRHFNNYNPAAPGWPFSSDPCAPDRGVRHPAAVLPGHGMNAVSARSDWTTSASWMSFRAGPYT